MVAVARGFLLRKTVEETTSNNQNEPVRRTGAHPVSNIPQTFSSSLFPLFSSVYAFAICCDKRVSSIQILFSDTQSPHPPLLSNRVGNSFCGKLSSSLSELQVGRFVNFYQVVIPLVFTVSSLFLHLSSCLDWFGFVAFTLTYSSQTQEAFLALRSFKPSFYTNTDRQTDLNHTLYSIHMQFNHIWNCLC
jgi:hypothetical protein